MENTKRYSGQIVLISGALGDIGQAVARAFVREGARVGLSDLPTAADAGGRLQQMGIAPDDYDYQSVDVRDSAAVEAWIDAVEARWTLPDMAVSNAARVTLKDFRELSDAEWMEELQVNLSGAYFLANGLAKRLEAAGQAGSILFLGSWAAQVVHGHIPAYSVSKAGVQMLCRSMALTYAASGIRVNELAPGYVQAGLSKVVWQEDPQAAEQARKHVPLGALIEANEVADQVLWICDPANRHLTGSTFLIDGGLSLVGLPKTEEKK